MVDCPNHGPSLHPEMYCVLCDNTGEVTEIVHRSWMMDMEQIPLEELTDAELISRCRDIYRGKIVATELTRRMKPRTTFTF